MPSRSLAVVAFALLLAVPVAGGGPACAEEAPADLAKLALTLDGAKVGGKVGPVEVFRVGHAEIRPDDPAHVLALVAGGRICGVLLPGRAKLHYRLDDRFSQSLARHNLKAWGPGLPLVGGESDLAIDVAVEAVAIWGFDLVPASTAVPESPLVPLPEWLADVLASRLPGDGNPGQDLADSFANQDPGYRWAILRRSGDDLLLDTDPRAGQRIESLGWRYRLPTTMGSLAGRWAMVPIVAQPLGRAWWEGSPTSLAAVDTEIEVVNPQGEQLQVTTRTQLQAQRDGIRLLSFDLRTGIRDFKDRFRPYQATRVTVNGAAAPYTHDRNRLLVGLAAPLKRGESVRVEVAAEGEILERPAGDSYWWLATEAWYPRPADDGIEWAELRIRAEVGKPFVPVVAGKELSRAVGESSTTVTTKLDRPMRNATVLAGKYTPVAEEQDGSRVRVWTYAAVREEEARRLAKLVFAVRGCYEHWLGVPYPFSDLDIVEVNDWGWGQAPPGMIYITKEALLTRSRAGADEDEEWIAGAVSRGINERIAHEVAHGWFPHVAKILQPGDNWLSESLSEYASAYCLQSSTADAKRGRTIFERQLREWKNLDAEIKPGASVFLANFLPWLGTTDGTREALLYGRGPLLLHAVRQELRKQKGEAEGDRLFLTWIRSYVKSFTYRVAETRHFIAILEQVTGQPWQPFFERYLYGPESPPVK